MGPQASDQQAYYNMMMHNSMLGQGEGKNAGSNMDPQVLQMMMAMQAGAMMGQTAPSCGSAAAPPTSGGAAGGANVAASGNARDPDFGDILAPEASLQTLARGGGPAAPESRRTKSRNKEREPNAGRTVPLDSGILAGGAPAVVAPQRERGSGGKGDRRRRGGGGPGRRPNRRPRARRRRRRRARRRQVPGLR